jgi:superfamily I DNA/RNA helicase
MDKHSLEFDIKSPTDDLITYGIDLCRAVLGRSIQVADSLIDFDDQLYMPVISGARFIQNDFLFVDEAQDVNQVQRAMLRRALKPGGRLIAVGDPGQAIYGFRGADVDAIDNIKKEFDAIELPLSISYRCPQSVVREAQQFVSHIQAASSAPEGKVSHLGKYGPEVFGSHDSIICRNTAPLIDLAYKLIRAHVPCKVKGRDIGQGLISLIRKLEPKSLSHLEDRLQSYAEREVAKFIAKGQEERADALMDRVTTIQVFMEMQPESGNVGTLIQSIESMFSDSNGCLMLCTIHKAKGLEWQKVFILDPDRMPSKWARQAWQKQQETNLQYVAVTRAKSELVYIQSNQFVVKSDQPVG